MTRSSLASAATVAAVMIGALVAGAARTPAIDTDVTGPVVLVASDRWAASVGPEEAARRTDDLRAAIQALRTETTSGWTGRQDDVTGYLAELTGGSLRAEEGASADELVRSFLDQRSAALLGAPPTQLELGPPQGPDPVGTVSFRIRQVTDGVPVLDADLVVVVADAAARGRITSVRGRVFPGIGPVGAPGIDAAAAVVAAEGASGGDAQGDPTLAVLAGGGEGGVLVWQVAVLGGGRDTDGATVTTYHVAASDGRVLGVRPGSAHLAPSARRPAAFLAAEGESPVADGQPVTVRGSDPFGREITAVGSRSADGQVALVDRTSSVYDPATGRGAILTFDASGMSEQSANGLPGAVVTAPGGVVGDPDAIAAHALTRYIAEYLHQVFGRTSWDGAGGDFVSSVNFEGPTWCNAVFAGGRRQMMYGLPCAPGGSPEVRTMVDPDVAAHEIVHGVTQTTANLLYTGQSGALNEAFSDYFGNVIGDAYLGRDSSTVMEEACEGFPEGFCQPASNGDMALRDLLNGATMQDYLLLLDPGGTLAGVGGSQDHAGVHLNSAIWNNVLWSIRSRLAEIDGTGASQSARARYFDTVVFTALTRYLGPSSGFVDARAAIEQAARDLQADAVVNDVVRETFDLVGICATCDRPAPSPALAVGASPATERRPAVAGDRIAWVEHPALENWGQAVATALGTGTSTPIGGAQDASSVAFAGDRLVVASWPDTGPPSIDIADPATGHLTPVDTSVGPRSVQVGVAGSAEGAAWMNLEAGTLNYVAAGSQTVTSASIPQGAIGPDDVVLSLATGGGTVVAGTLEGTVLVWRVGGQPEVLRSERPVLAVAADGPRIVVLPVASPEFDGQRLALPLARVELVDLDGGGRRVLSESALPLGVAMDGDYVVWPQATALLGGAINASEARAGSAYVETDLHLFSAATGVTYRVLGQKGQQGLPALDGNRLSWQDAVRGGNDIFTGVLPAGL